MDNSEKIIFLLENLTQKVTSIDNRLGTVEDKVNSMDIRFSSVEGQQKEDTDMIGALIHRIDELSAAVEGLTVSIAKEFAEVKRELGEVNAKLDNLTDDFAILKTKTYDNDFEINRLKKKIS